MIMIPEAAKKLAAAFAQAHKLQARLVIVCDTAKQARMPKQTNPLHHCIPISRLFGFRYLVERHIAPFAYRQQVLKFLCLQKLAHPT